MSKVTLIADATILGKAIDAWGKAGQKWVKQGHVLALSALQRLNDHGDIGFVNRLYLSMPKGTKSAAMAEWVITYGSVVANTEADKKEKPFVYANDKECDCEEAAKNPWFDFKPEPAPDKLFDVQAAVMAIIKKAATAKQVAHGDMLAKLAAMVGADAPAGNDDSLMDDLAEKDDLSL